ncbi:hypothetical protein ACIBCS_36320 [Streptomyces phaeochromogenes]
MVNHVNECGQGVAGAAGKTPMVASLYSLDAYLRAEDYPSDLKPAKSDAS